MMDTKELPDLPAPMLRDRAPMTLIGLAERVEFEAIPTIPAIWAAFNPRMPEIELGAEPAAYGACFNNDAQGFRYLAGAPAVAGSAIPEGLERLNVPGGKYAVWVHEGPVGDMHLTMRAIFEKALPDAGLTTRNAPELERYDESFDANAGRGRVEIWIPVS